MGILYAIFGAIFGFATGYVTAWIFKLFMGYLSLAQGWILGAWIILLLIMLSWTANLLTTLKARSITAANWVVFSGFFSAALLIMIVISLLNGISTFGL